MRPSRHSDLFTYCTYDWHIYNTSPTKPQLTDGELTVVAMKITNIVVPTKFVTTITTTVKRYYNIQFWYSVTPLRYARIEIVFNFYRLRYILFKGLLEIYPSAMEYICVCILVRTVLNPHAYYLI